ncbi:MAG: pyridoxal-phosphate dependent enzyme [Clostridiales bacterium]|nr:pyridoxal-phosphate dependent enzyme [Clostridiales bacterium]
MLELKDVLAARERISPYIRHTPLLRLAELDKLAGFEVYVKPENLQGTGSFKLRGASNKLLSLAAEEQKRGVVAASSGNHAQGVAAAAARLGIDALIVMPEDAPALKVMGTQAWGAKVVLHGHLSGEREARMDELAAQEGRVKVHSYADEFVKAGQGTAALEILEDEPEISAIVAPVGGGGLISGLSTAAKGQKPKITMVGVEPAAAARYQQSRAAGRPLTIEIGQTIADGTRGNYASPVNFPLVEVRVDELVDADDQALQAAIYAYAKLAKLVVEPSGALSLAALLSGKLSFLKGTKVCLVISGGNLDFAQYAHWLAEGAKTFEKTINNCF